MTALRRPLALCALAALAACSDFSGPEGAVHLELLSGATQQAPAGAVLPAPVAVKVIDAALQPVQGELVYFHAGAGGSFAPDSVRTDQDGMAEAAWRLGPAAGQQSATVGLVSKPRLALVLTATALPPAPSPR